MKRPSLNHVYRLVWNDVLGAFVAVAEGTRGKGKPGGRLLAATLLGAAVLSASAAPTGGVVTNGSAVISQSGAVTNINQSTQKAVINWQGFSIGASETVNFNQPNSSALTLNRVIGNEKSVIEGALNANGRIFLINSNGMLFTKGSSVNTGGFVGSTLNLSDEDFNAGNYVFKSSGSAGSIINLGTITAKDGGYVALLGNSVSNQGVIVATKGTVALSAGNKITLNFNGDSLLSVSIDEGTLNALIENRQAIYADGGTVILTARAADELLGAQVNNSGIVQARTIDDLKGSITLYAHGGTAHVDGTLDASAPTGGDGGFIETSGATVNVADSAFVTTKATNGKTGTWLIDPNDFVVAASGGNMTGAAVGNALANNNYTIDTHTMGNAGGNGDITINDAITWSSNNTLTLTAERNININNAVTANGSSAGLAMNYGGDYNIRTKASYSGTELNAAGIPVAKVDSSGGVYGSITLSGPNATLDLNGERFTLVHSWSQLVGYGSLTGKYALAGDLDASGQSYKFYALSYLNGNLAGLGHAITGLNISILPSDLASQNVWDYFSSGFLGVIRSGSVVRDLALVNANVLGLDTAAILAGTNNGTVSHVYVSGNVSGNWNVGGMVGYNAGTVSDSSAVVNIYGDSALELFGYSGFGGLVGQNAGLVNGSSATGTLTARLGDPSTSVTDVGGLVGANYNQTISNSYANVTVLASSQANNVGGLLGGNYGSAAKVLSSFAGGNVSVTGVETGTDVIVGGLVGLNSGGLIDGSHATGNVLVQGSTSSHTAVGGLVGKNDINVNDDHYGVISNSYATGNVSGTIAAAGGLVGVNNAAISGSYASGSVFSSFINAAIGGLAGKNSVHGTVVNSGASGDVSGSAIDTFAGGLVGMNEGALSDVYASGNVSVGGSNSYAGGLAGINLGNIGNARATGSIDAGPGKSDGLTGTNEWQVNGVLRSGSIGNSTYVDVAAQEATALAERLAAFRESATQQATSEVAQVLKPSTPVPVSGGIEPIKSSGTSLDQNIVFADTRSFSTDIRRIEVDGKTFILDEEGDGKDKSPAAPVR